MIALAVLVAAASASHILSTGASSQYRSQDNHGNYAFGYNEDHATGGTFRRESGNAAGQVVGSYGLRDADGRLRTVNYVADALGYRANINTNEPGVDSSKDPANTLINKAAIAHAPIVAAPTHYAAPVIAAAPAPVLAAAPAKIIAAAPAPILGSSYSTHVNHGAAWAAAPIAHHAAPLLAAPAHHAAAWGYAF